MNGTLISHPPGGGGSGSSVTNGGPAWTEPIAIKQPIVTKRKGSLIIRTTSIFLDWLRSIIRRGKRGSRLVVNRGEERQQTRRLVLEQKVRCERRPLCRFWTKLYRCSDQLAR